VRLRGWVDVITSVRGVWVDGRILPFLCGGPGPVRSCGIDWNFRGGRREIGGMDAISAGGGGTVSLTKEMG